MKKRISNHMKSYISRELDDTVLKGFRNKMKYPELHEDKRNLDSLMAIRSPNWNDACANLITRRISSPASEDIESEKLESTLS